jgi:hypothetical protein
VLWGLVGHIESEVPVVVDGASFRSRWHGRWPEMRVGLTVCLLWADFFLIAWSDGVLDVPVSFGMLLFFYGVEVLYATQRQEGQTWADTLPCGRGRARAGRCSVVLGRRCELHSRELPLPQLPTNHGLFMNVGFDHTGARARTSVDWCLVKDSWCPD